MGWSNANSTSVSNASGNFSPASENILMPLSGNGLCDAEITIPACDLKAFVR